MLREILESESWKDDSELVFQDILKLVKNISSKIGSSDADARVYRSLELAKDGLEKALRRL